MDEEEKEVIEKMSRAVIAGASEALKKKAENPNSFDEEVMKFITLNAKKIAENID